MTKQEAVKLFIEREFNSVPTTWVEAIAEHVDGNPINPPMWGTMFIVDDTIGSQLLALSELVKLSEDCEAHYSRTQCNNCKNYEEEMDGARHITGTCAYIYNVDNTHVIGINGAGFDFFDGVWDKFYDLLAIKWHEE